MHANNSEKAVSNDVKGFNVQKEDNLHVVANVQELKERLTMAEKDNEIAKKKSGETELGQAIVSSGNFSADSLTVKNQFRLFGKPPGIEKQGNGTPQDTRTRNTPRYPAIRGPRTDPQRFYDTFSK